MYIFIYIYIDIDIYVDTYMYISIYIYTHVGVCIYIIIYIYVHTCPFGLSCDKQRNHSLNVFSYTYSTRTHPITPTLAQSYRPSSTVMIVLQKSPRYIRNKQISPTHNCTPNSSQLHNPRAHVEQTQFCRLHLLDAC